MSVIRTSPLAICGKVDVYCSRCDSRIGTLTLQEVKELSISGVNVLCFRCDSLGVDNVPDVLYLAEEQYLLTIGDKPFLADWRGDRHKLLPISWSAWMTLVSGVKPADSLFLSSSTYSNAVCKFCGGREEVVQGSCIGCDAKSRLSDD